MRSLRALGLYAVLTVALTWPFAANLRVMDAGDSAFFAWEIGWTVHALKTSPAELPHANIFHPLRYTLGMDEPVLGTTLLVAAARPLHRRRGAALQRRPAAHLPLLGADGLLAGERAGRRGVGRAPRGGAVRVLADPHRPDRPPLDARDAVVAARAAVHDPLRARQPDQGRAARGALLRARVPGLRLPRGDRGGGAAARAARPLLGPLGPAEGGRAGGRCWPASRCCRST